MKLLASLTVFASAFIAACTEQESSPISSFDPFLTEWERAQTAFINGNPSSWKKNASQGEDATIFGAFGGSEKGWAQVSQRFEWASGQFKDSGGTEKFEYLNKQVSGDLAFTVAIERQTAWLADQPAPTARALRVTQIFRREGGTWKLLHRHADPLVERLPPPERK